MATNVKTRLRTFLRASEFGAAEGAAGNERRTDGLVQGIEPQPGAGAKRGRSTVNIYWWFESELSPGALAFSQRIGWFREPRCDWWVAASPNDDEWLAVQALLSGVVLPFLDKYRTPGDVLRGVESGSLDPEMAFGEDPGWRWFNQAMAAKLADRDELMHDCLERLSTFADSLDLSRESEEYVQMIEVGARMSDSARR